MSNVLTSLLRGAGYSAYVVSGYAPHYLTTQDQSDEACPILEDSKCDWKDGVPLTTSKESDITSGAQKYLMKPRPDHNSRFEEYQRQRDVERVMQKQKEEEVAW
eukprot:839177_1